MIYGHNSTIHGTQKLNVEVDHKGRVVSVWFRCAALPFDVRVADKARAAEMIEMSTDVNQNIRLNAVDFEQVCTKPPKGWRCTREAGHDGPCAAIAESK
jgi:hypothetical protein